MKRTHLVVGACILAAGLVGYAFGRHTAPDKVVEKEVIRTVTKEDTTAREEVKRLTEQLETVKRQTHKETTMVVNADGSKTIKSTVDTKVDRTNDTRTDLDTKTDMHRVATVESVREVTKLVERRRPDWRIGPMVGFDVRSRSISYGATVERRILGPVSVGAWGLSNGTAGLVLTLEF